MQAAALHALHQWVRHSGKTSTLYVESLLVPLSEGLRKAVGRAELMTWAVEHVRQPARPQSARSRPKRILTLAQMDSECIIMTLVYVERLITATRGRLELQRATWRRMLFCVMVIASKVWDDLSMTNADFAHVGPKVLLQDMNEIELVYLHAVD
ncbi:hypothetical protein PsorP6_006834 [Peronosclerospora sorghi]|uniref:Uncharacterized protein n=1 Tax=Peronosclerospora sorghi TaxID=230839 RepID=A0ACC0WAV6_9STRA|nr:hypothetical protein PsorP6_006834 [Peronosclerospora sorghi]